MIRALLFVVAIFLLLVFNELSECKDSYIVAAIAATIVSIIPPMFYRSGIAKKLVIVVHIICNGRFASPIDRLGRRLYEVCKTKAGRDTVLVYASTIVVAYAMITVAGHFMKRPAKSDKASTTKFLEKTSRSVERMSRPLRRRRDEKEEP